MKPTEKQEAAYYVAQKNCAWHDVKEAMMQLENIRNKYAGFIIARNDGEFADSKFANLENGYLESLAEAENNLAVAFTNATPFFQIPTDFSKNEDPPSWAHLGDRDELPNPLEFKNVAWMRRGSSYGGKHVVWICLIGGEPIELKGFSDADAWRLIDSWQDYRVGLPILATKGNVNDRQPS